MSLLRLLLHSGAALRAVIVDHAVRPGSEAAAAAALAQAQALGAPAEIVRLTWERTPSGQAAWRQARLAALFAAAHRAGGDTIALGHTRDDQIETLYLRLAAGTGWRGLAGMAVQAPAPLWPEGRGLWLWRPLLGSTRADLRRTLHEAGLGWFEDPANTEARFARVRARQALAAAPAIAQALHDLAGPAARLAAAVDAAALQAAAVGVAYDADRLRIDHAVLENLPAAALARLVAAALTAAGAGRRVAEEADAARLLARLQAGERALTFAGAKLELREDGLWFGRDPGAIGGRGGQARLAPWALPPGQAVMWDGRAELRSQAAGWTIAADRRGRLLLNHDHQRRSAGAVSVSWLLQERLESILWRGRTVSDSG